MDFSEKELKIINLLLTHSMINKDSVKDIDIHIGVNPIETVYLLGVFKIRYNIVESQHNDELIQLYKKMIADLENSKENSVNYVGIKSNLFAGGIYINEEIDKIITFFNYNNPPPASASVPLVN